MNWLIFISGLFAGFCTLGHFAVGSKQYLKPMLQSSFDEVAKKVMHCVFHYVSVFLVLSTVVLLAVGLGYGFGQNSTVLVKFIAINFALFAVSQIIIAASSGIQNAVFKMFQWIIFILIAVPAWIGA